MLYDGKLGALRERFGGKRELVIDLDEATLERNDVGHETVSIAGAEIIARDGKQVTYRFDRNVLTASELIGRLSAHYSIRDLQVREPEIEETVRRIYEERLLEDE